MKTKLTLIAALFAFCYGHSQDKKYTDVQIGNYSKKIDSIIVSEKGKMNIELDALEKNFKENKISSEEKQSRRLEIAQKYEDIINGKVEEQKNTLEAATKELVKNSVMGKSSIFEELKFSQNNALLSFRDPKKTKKELLESVDINFSLGFTNLTKSAGSMALFNKDSDVLFGKSTSLTFEVRYTNQLGSLTSPIFYRIGLGGRSDGYRLANSKVITQTGSQISLSDFSLGTLRGSSISNNYVIVPVDFVFVMNPKYTVENGEKMLDNSKGNFRLTAGVYGGVRYLSQSIVQFENFNGNRSANRENINGSANNFLFGGKLSLGYGALNVFIKKDFTAAFNDNAQLSNKYGIQIGLELLYVNF